MQKDWLKKKNVVVVGASAGVGKHLAFNLILKYNCNVYAISENKKQMEDFVSKMGEYKENISYEIFDATKERKWQEFVEKLNAENIKVDILINCVGELPTFKSFNEFSQDEMSSIMNKNFYSSIFSIRHLLPFLKQSKSPTIVNISCLSSVMSVGGNSAYSASKAALKSYTEVLASELDGKFYVSLVILGTIKTDFYNNQSESISKKILQGATTPQEAANKIIIALLKKKERVVIGFKTRAYDHLSRLFPTMFRKYTKKLMDKKKIKLYDENV